MRRLRNFVVSCLNKISRSLSESSDPSSLPKLRDVSAVRDEEVDTFSAMAAVMRNDDVVLVLGDRTDEIGGIPITGCEYETFWTEGDHVCWKVYSPTGAIVIQMKTNILMECLLGDANIMARFFNVKEK